MQQKRIGFFTKNIVVVHDQRTWFLNGKSTGAGGRSTLVGYGQTEGICSRVRIINSGRKCLSRTGGRRSGKLPVVGIDGTSV